MRFFELFTVLLPIEVDVKGTTFYTITTRLTEYSRFGITVDGYKCSESIVERLIILSPFNFLNHVIHLSQDATAHTVTNLLQLLLLAIGSFILKA